MAVKFDYLTYPTIITNADWQKKKSFLDKSRSATKTGLGDTLVKAQAAWKKVNFAKMEAKSVLGRITGLDVVTSAKLAAQQELAGPVKAAEDALMQASRTARTTSTNAKLSSSAKTAATAISAKTMEMAAKLKTIKLDDFDEAADKYRNAMTLQAAGVVAKLKNAIPKLDKFITDARKDPTSEGLKAGITPARDVSQNIINIRKMRALGIDVGKDVPDVHQKVLVKWADTKTGRILPKEATREQCIAALDELDRALDFFKTIN